MSIVTKTGDKGETGLYGGRRVSKAKTRMHAIGSLDELSAILGLVLAERMLPPTLRIGLVRIQNQLFTLGADLATPLTPPTPTKRILEKHVHELEEWIAEWEARLPPLTKFILPGGSKIGAELHVSRTVCRRAERWIVAVKETEDVNPHALIYINRLSDLLFLLARAVNKEGDVQEREVEYT